MSEKYQLKMRGMSDWLFLIWVIILMSEVVVAILIIKKPFYVLPAMYFIIGMYSVLVFGYWILRNRIKWMKKNGLLSAICEECGKTFFRNRYDMIKSKHRFCSTECYQKNRGKDDKK